MQKGIFKRWGTWEGSGKIPADLRVLAGLARWRQHPVLGGESCQPTLGRSQTAGYPWIRQGVGKICPYAKVGIGFIGKLVEDQLVQGKKHVGDG